MSAEKLQGATATQSAFALPALCLLVCRKEIEVTISVRERERERETMVRHLEISIEVTTSGKERQWFDNWK
jgi:hypothetical protein